MSGKIRRLGGGYLLEPALAVNEQPRYWLGAGLVLTALWGGFILTLFFGAFNIWLYGLVLVTSLVALARAPEAGVVALVLCTMLFEHFFTLQETVVGESSYKFYLVDALLLLTSGAFYLGGRFEGWRLGAVDKAIVWLNLILGVYFLASFSLFGADAVLAFSAFKTYAFYSLIYFLVRALLKKAGGRQVLEESLIYGGLGILVFLAVGILAGQGLWVGATPLSTAGSRILAPTHAFYLLFPLLIIIANATFPSWLTRHKALAASLAWAWIFGIVLSLARHLWLVLAGQAILIWRLLPAVRARLLRLARPPLMTAGAILAILFVLNLSAPAVFQNSGNSFIDSVATRARSLVSSDDVSINWRKALWREGWNSWVSRPVFGLGLGRELTFQLQGTVFTKPVRELHNSVFALLVQTGLVGAAFFGYLLWRLFRQINWRSRAETIPVIAVSGVLLASLFGTYFEANFLIIFFWLSVGWLVGAKAN